MVQTMQLILEILPVAVHLVVDVPAVQLQGPQVQFVRVDVAVFMQRQFQQLSVPDRPQIRSSTSLLSASEGFFCCRFAAFFGLRPSGR